MSDYTLNILKMKSKKYEDYVNCINPDYNRDEEAANEVITRFNEYEKENQELKNQLETLEKANKQLISKLDKYDAIVDERDELKKQKEELRDYLKARIEVCDNRLSMPFCDFEKATKERLILSQCLDKLEKIIGDTDE